MLNFHLDPSSNWLQLMDYRSTCIKAIIDQILHNDHDDRYE